MSLKINGVELKLDERDAAVISAHLDAQSQQLASKDAQIAQLQAAAGKATGEQAALQAKLDAATARLAQVDRSALESDARKVLGADAKFDGKEDNAVRAAVIAKVFPTLKLDGKSAEYTSALFDTAVAQSTETSSKPTKPAPKPAHAPRQDSGEGAPAKSPREEMIEKRRNMALKSGAGK